jgi:hypothetical protein
MEEMITCPQLTLKNSDPLSTINSSIIACKEKKDDFERERERERERESY